jgi:hypothetical protein
MENLFSKLEDLAGTVKEYIDNRVESAKLSVAEKSSAVIANTIARLFLFMVLFFFLLFSGLALSLFLGNVTGNAWLGYLIVAVLYALFGMIVWLGRGSLIRRPVMNKMIKLLLKKDDL